MDVFWPRGLRGELIPQARVEVASGPREGPLYEGLFGPGALFEFDWRLALGDDVLSDDEMAALAGATTPVIRLRDNWMIIDPVVARRARKRKAAQKVKPVVALQSALTGTIDLDGEQVEVHAGASLLKVRDRIVDAATVSPLEAPAALDATLRDYQRHGLTWLAELTGVGLGACLADDMGLGKTITLIALHLHRRQRGLAQGPTLVVCPASLMGNWETEIHRFAPGVAVRRFHGSSRRLVSASDEVIDDGFVLTTYGTMRRDHATLSTVAWDLVVADEAQHIKNAQSSTARNLRTIESRCRVALTGTPVENNLTELWAILDWATPGLLGSRAAFRKVWAAPIESGVDPAVARRFAQLVEPFLLRRRKSDPGIAPELPGEDRDRPRDRADPRAGGALRGAGARVDGPDRARRRDHPPRAGAGPADRAQADLQPPGALPAAGRRPAPGPLGEARPVRRAARHDPVRERLGADLHAVRRDGAPARTPLRRRPRSRRCSSTAAPRSGPASRWCATSRTARRRCSCSRSRRAAPAST